MSPRAAALLEQFGFTHVYDYVGGKADWLAVGLPVEGEATDEPRNIDLCDPSPETCCMDEDAATVAARLGRKHQETCVVTDDGDIVLGLVRLPDLKNHDDTPLHQVMELGPSTFRPNGNPGDAFDYMNRHDVPDVVITTAYGKLIGLLRKEAAAEMSPETD